MKKAKLPGWTGRNVLESIGDTCPELPAGLTAAPSYASGVLR